MKNDKYEKAICQLIRVSYYKNDLQTLRLIYETLVIELWNEFKEKIPFSHTSYLMYFKDSNSKIDFSVVMLLQEKYPYFMGILNEK